jgi:D-beta-D-heptose 7-phosphate kinase/D-beta-D-heptose 1-phosphate adenosyltransferase
MLADLAAERLSALIGDFTGKRLLVIGDLMLDEFIWGNVSRISPEAPVPIVNVTGESYYPGGAANVARNLREFTDHVAVMGVTGSDAAGQKLLKLLEECGIDIHGVQQESVVTTTVKTRIIARHQQVVRVDRERKTPLAGHQAERAAAHLEDAIAAVDAVIVADYGKGFLTQPFADHICRTARRHWKVLTVDPHPHTSLSWRGATALKPNRAEAFLAAGVPLSDPILPVSDDALLLEAGRRLLASSECGSLLITLGEHGMLLFERNAEPYHIPARVQDVFDVSGAGDTAISVFTLALAARGTPTEAAELANRASGVAVGKLGTATVKVSELQASLMENGAEENGTE